MKKEIEGKKNKNLKNSAWGVVPPLFLMGHYLIKFI